VKEALAWLHEQTEKSERILIHCKHGLSRSPAFLAAFMVERGISSSLDEAKATILIHRPVQFATQIVESVSPVVLISPLTGLPNRRAFEKAKASPFVAIADVIYMRIFNNMFGPIAGDKLLCRLGHILISAGLDAYHDGDEFLCKAESHQELSAKLSHARQMFREPFQTYAEGRIQAIEGLDFSFAIGTNLAEAEAALHESKKVATRKDPPEWLRRLIATRGPGHVW
jgi:GGDEF domain-containing protein